MPETDGHDAKQAHKSGRTRSPNFPAIGLGAAVERARDLYQKEGRHRAPYDVVVKHWGYTPTSSSALQTVGALNAYGLIEVEGKGKHRYIRLSDRALRIIEDKRESSPERVKAYQEAALAPPIHRDVWEVYGAADETSEENFETFLLREKEFNPKSVKRFIAQYKATVEVAGLDSGDILTEEDDDKGGASEGGGPNLKDVLPFSAFFPQKGGGGQESQQKNEEMRKTEKQFAIDLPGEGRVVLHTPDRMSEESIEFLKLWLERCWKTVRAEDRPSGSENGTPRE